MDKDEKKKMSQSSAKETTPLLGGKDSPGPYAKPVKPGKYNSITEPCGDNSAAARTSRKSERHEGPSTAGEVMPVPENEDEELADAVNSYEGMADMTSPAFGCGLFFGIWLCMCHCLSSFMVQFPLHVLLLGLPISVGFMGAKYMNKCPMNIKLPYAMMVVGAVGTLVLLVRLALLLHTKFSTNDILKNWLKKWTILQECLFLPPLILELYFSYEKSPNFSPLNPNYCNEAFYYFVTSMNSVLITLVFIWGFLHFITAKRCLRRDTPP